MNQDDVRERFRRLPLASKCLVLFGVAAAAITALAMLLPLFRMNVLVGAGQATVMREVAAWVRSLDPPLEDGDARQIGTTTVRRLSLEAALDDEDPFVRRAARRLERDPDRSEVLGGRWEGWAHTYDSARAVRTADGEVGSVLVFNRISDDAGAQLVVNLLFVTVAGSVVLAVALIVFAIITNRLILAPVESLKETAERVREGRLDTRSEIHTGDEYEELADTFNLMLSELESQQQQLRAINKAMDLKLSELAEANVALYEAARLKGDFLARVSHELRTPLNSIIGFAELLLEIAKKESAESAKHIEANEVELAALEKRGRYLANIVTAGRTLLELIESLLEMAKLEAGRVDVRVEPMDLAESCQALVGLIYPLAHRKGIKVSLDVARDTPTIYTDVKKFQQVVFNLLSNAVKFTEGTERPGEITLRAERLPAGESSNDEERVRVSVLDNGPGIDEADQSRIFESFEQGEAGHTRGHSGAGLGLAIVSELTKVLQGEVQLVSEPGHGAMFCVILPVKLEPREAETTALEARFRGALAKGEELTNRSDDEDDSGEEDSAPGAGGAGGAGGGGGAGGSGIDSQTAAG